MFPLALKDPFVSYIGTPTCNVHPFPSPAKPLLCCTPWVLLCRPNNSKRLVRTKHKNQKHAPVGTSCMSFESNPLTTPNSKAGQSKIKPFAQSFNIDKEKEFLIPSLPPSSHKRRVLLQIPHQIIHIRQMLAQHFLLALGAQRLSPRAHPTLPHVHQQLAGAVIPRQGTQWARLATATAAAVPVVSAVTRRDGGGRGGSRRRRRHRFGHEVEVQELHGLELDVAGGRARFED